MRVKYHLGYTDAVECLAPGCPQVLAHLVYVKLEDPHCASVGAGVLHEIVAGGAASWRRWWR